MKENKEIYVFVCEDKDSARQIIDSHFEKGKVTFAQLFKEENRDKIVKAIEDFE